MTSWVILFVICRICHVPLWFHDALHRRNQQTHPEPVEAVESDEAVETEAMSLLYEIVQLLLRTVSAVLSL